MKVYALQSRSGKTKYYKGVVIGRQSFKRQSMAIFNKPAAEYNEDKLLVKMSDRSTITVWESEVFVAVAREHKGIKPTEKTL